MRGRNEKALELSGRLPGGEVLKVVSKALAERELDGIHEPQMRQEVVPGTVDVEGSEETGLADREVMEESCFPG